MYRVLIIEDDEVISGIIRKQLTRWGLEGRSIEDFRNIMAEFTEFDPQLVLLDISLPFFNGYYWCTEIRKVSKVPIVFLSSAADNMNIVMAMNMGGDDFVSKPFDLNVLMAKVQAILRRSYDYIGHTNLMEHRGVLLNTSDATILYKGERIELSKNESRILMVLIEHKGEIVPRDVMMNKLWETDSFVDENTLSVNILRLRRKLEAAGIMDYIITKKGIGYLVE